MGRLISDRMFFKNHYMYSGEAISIDWLEKTVNIYVNISGALYGPNRTMAAMITAGIEASTLRSYSTHVRKYQKYLVERGLSKFDCSKEATYQYILHMSLNKGTTYDSMKPIRGNNKYIKALSVSESVICFIINC